MAIVRSKNMTPDETAALVSATAIARGLDIAKTAIVGILGRGKPFTAVHVGITDIDLGKTVQDRQGYAVAAIYTASSSHVVAAVGKAVTDWLRACHGARCEATPAKPVVKPGTKTLYLAVSRGA